MDRLVGWLVHKNSSLFVGLSIHPGWLKFGMDIKNVCVKACICVHANWLKGGVVMGVAHCKKVHNFRMDLHTWTRFSGKVGHEPKDS